MGLGMSFAQRAFFKISPEMLVKKLGLPTGTEIHGVSYDPLDATYSIVIDHPSFASVATGQRFPEVRAEYTQVHCAFVPVREFRGATFRAVDHEGNPVVIRTGECP